MTYFNDYKLSKTVCFTDKEYQVRLCTYIRKYLSLTFISETFVPEFHIGVVWLDQVENTYFYTQQKVNSTWGGGGQLPVYWTRTGLLGGHVGVPLDFMNLSSHPCLNLHLWCTVLGPRLV